MAVGAPHQVLSGKYRLERELGRGGMGSVWLAQHLTLRSSVAIKLIDPAIATNPEALSRFLREAQAAASLRSPHVVQILDHGVDDGVPFIVMELLDGESLASRLERQRQLSPQDTANIMTQVCRAMNKAHEAGIVHRDLKPDNIFIVRNDEEEICKVLDFGVAKSHTHGVAAVSSATRTGSVLGTPYYMSPEQAEGSKLVDHRTDVWAIGVMAWECLVGARPFEAETLGGLLLAICAREMPVPSRCGAVPAGFDAWFARACARDLNYRFVSAKEAAQELRVVCGGGMMSGANAVPPPVSVYGAVQAASLPLASTTAHLGMSASTPATKKSAAPWVVLGVLGLGAVGGGAFFAMRGTDHADAAASAAHSAESPPSDPARAAAAPVLAEPTKPIADTPALDATPSVSAAPVAPAAVAAPPVAHVAARPLKPHAPAAVEKPKPAAAAPAPTPAAPAQPAVRPRVNLGI